MGNVSTKGAHTGSSRRRGLWLTLAVVGVLAAGAAALLALRGAPGGRGAGEAASAQLADEPGYTTVKVERGSIRVTVPASGKLEPCSTLTVRPDPNMPTRKLTRILVEEGQQVVSGQALAEVDASGLDLELESARASYQAAKIKLENISSGPTSQELAAAEVALRQAEVTLKQSREGYESTKKLAEKGLVARDQLLDAERQLELAELRHQAQAIQYQDTKDGAGEDAIRGQEAALAQASNSLRKAELVAASTVIRAPEGGVLADIAVHVGDLVSAATAIMTIADMDPMLLAAMVDESDVRSVRHGQRAEITVESDPEATFAGTVTALAVKAQVQSNITVFAATIEIPNPTGALLWGMNADSEIVVTEATDALLVPLEAVQRSGQNATVNIPDRGKLISWQVLTGADDGAKIQILRGLDEGDEVAVAKRKTTTTTSPSRPQTGAFGGAGAMFRIGR